MKISRRAMTVGTTFFLAAATGHVMQNGETISARLRGGEVPEKPVLAAVTSTAAATVPVALPKADPVPAAAPGVELAAATPAAPAKPEPLPPVAPAPVLTAAGLPDLPKAEPKPLAADLRLAGRIETLDTSYTKTGTAADATYSVFGIACADPSLALEPSARGMVKVTLAAPCFANERVTVTHAGLVVALATDAAGDLDLMLPALASPAEVAVRFASGEVVSARHEVTGLEALARVGVQWQGAGGLHLHAFETGAGFGMPGHVSAASPRDRATAAGGFLTLIGDAAVDHPLLAEVYTAPAGTPLSEMIVEAEVTEATCGRLLTGQILRMVPGAGATESLSFAMPSCDTVGDSLLLGLAPVTVPAVAVLTAATAPALLGTPAVATAVPGAITTAGN